jgi:hypothetical protein
MCPTPICWSQASPRRTRRVTPGAPMTMAPMRPNRTRTIDPITTKTITDNVIASVLQGAVECHTSLHQGRIVLLQHFGWLQVLQRGGCKFELRIAGWIEEEGDHQSWVRRVTSVHASDADLYLSLSKGDTLSTSHIGIRLRLRGPLF